ncbi:hypothetical protein BE61_p0090 (plasmid) [Bradyrhizobium elkanii USDA 61]|nr:hypothetical protein BE61_p0090 [Bradyrhizobium elkanii USDA 61]
MGAPVAKTHGMKTGGPNRFSHSDLKATGVAAKRSSTLARHLDHASSLAMEIVAISKLGASVEVAIARLICRSFDLI